MFRATGRQPIELGWRAAFPDWQPAEERGEDVQLLPALRDGEAARLSEAKVEAKETRPPPRYNEGTLIDAMQNAWRFVADESLRERLKEAKGIGTPATRGEVIRGLKAQEFLVADGKHIVPTERGLLLHGVLQRADPALVDPGVTAQMERLLDDVLVGRQDMISAIDAVCAQASRIIARLTALDAMPTALVTESAPDGRRHGSSARRSSSSRPRAPARSHIDSAPGADAVSSSAPRTAAKPRRPTRSLAAGAPEPDPDHTRAEPKRRKPRQGGSKTNPNGGYSNRPVVNSIGDVPHGATPLRIPYGNKETAQALGARYRAGGWYAPADIALTAFRERGWL